MSCLEKPAHQCLATRRLAGCGLAIDLDGADEDKAAYACCSCLAGEIDRGGDIGFPKQGERVGCGFPHDMDARRKVELVAPAVSATV